MLDKLIQEDNVMTRLVFSHNDLHGGNIVTTNADYEKELKIID